MRRLSLLTLVALVVAGCMGVRENRSLCHIEGVVIDRPESKELELYAHIDGEAAMSSRPMAKIPILDGKFSYDLLLDQPDYYILSFAEEKACGSWFPIRFMADGDTVRLTLYPEGRELEHRIEGTGATAEFQHYKELFGALDERYYEQTDSLDACGNYYSKEYGRLMKRIKSVERDSEEFAALLEKINSFDIEEQLSAATNEVIQDDKSKRKALLLEILDNTPTLARYALLAEQMRYRQPDKEVIEIYEQRYADTLTEHYLSAYCHRQLSGLQMGVGSRYVDFEAPDLKGEMHRFSELMEGTELTLLDLWASWCAPCRRTSKALIPLYEAYKSKGFRVIAVAREAENTKQMEYAIEQDGYPWPQLVELDDRTHLWSQYGSDNAAGRKILFDKTGLILAIDPSVEELEALLAERLAK